MKKLLREKKQLLDEIDAFIENAPEGGLKIQRRNGKVYYYRQTKDIKAGKWEKTYIKRNQLTLAKELAQKGYLSTVRHELAKQIDLLHGFIDEYHGESIGEIFSQLPEDRKVLVEPVCIGIKEKADAWNNEKYEPYLAFPENMIYETEQGEMVRSKSELIIANVLFQYRDIIEYKYERPLELKKKDGSSVIVHPDFTIFNKRTGKKYYYEHAGRMDEPKYAVEFVKKMNLYSTNDILQGRELIVTYETYNMPLELKNVKIAIQRILEEF